MKLDRLLLFGLNRENYQTEPGYNDIITASKKKTEYNKKYFKYIGRKCTIHFNYDNVFNRYINSYINTRPSDLHFDLL